MNSRTDNNLLGKNKVNDISAEDRQQLDGYIAVARSLARLTYESIYIIDYATMQFEYVSENPLFLCGHTPEAVLAMGYDFYFRHVPEADLKLLDTINEAGFDFFEKLPLEEKPEYYITYDFHLVDEQGKQVLVNHKLTPLFLTGQGKMWKALCVVSLAHHQASGNVAIYRQGSDTVWLLDTDTGTWRRSAKPVLTERELDALRLYAQGLTISQIAARLFVSVDTVKYYRRRIFEHFEVNNIVAALSRAVAQKVI